MAEPQLFFFIIQIKLIPERFAEIQHKVLILSIVMDGQFKPAVTLQIALSKAIVNL